MRNFDDIIEATREDLKESEALILRLNKKPLSEEDINHYSKVFGFDSDDAKAGCKPYTKEEKYLLAVNRYCYWHYATSGTKAGMLTQTPN
ncbi:hypothetical protein [Brachyspira aalborgi]|uniref:Uncharacterized protein n=1 Tax=Brachyspira aalborgi TaxID=29522 RepID=A0A5C8FUU7_9SPIR|nr:hypothetical protein [Brachyspira aalborgi]TXJ53392.1 hypothetical protein EPJ76_11840 [Brachyspira aalborgi]